MATEGVIDRPLNPPLTDELGEIVVRGLRPGRKGLEALGEMVLLGGAVFKSLRTGIVWDEFIHQCDIFFKRMIVPVLLIGLGWGTMVSLEAGNLLQLAQASWRLGGFEAMSHIREFDAFVMGDIAMGVAGTAIVADMGARKVRDELAAMSTLGIDVVREMVTPRVLSMIVMTSAMLFPMMVSSLFTGCLPARREHRRLLARLLQPDHLGGRADRGREVRLLRDVRRHHRLLQGDERRRRRTGRRPCRERGGGDVDHHGDERQLPGHLDPHGAEQLRERPQMTRAERHG